MIDKLLNPTILFSSLVGIIVPAMIIVRNCTTALLFTFVVLGVKNIDFKKLKSYILSDRFVQVFICFLLYGVISAYWSEFTLLSFKKALLLLSLGIAGVVFYFLYSNVQPKLKFMFIAISTGILIITPLIIYDVTHQFVLVNMIRDYQINVPSYYNRISVILSFLIWPMIWRLFKGTAIEKVFLTIAITLSFLTIFTLQNAASKVVLISGIIIFASSYIMPRILPWLICGVTVFYMLVAPFVHKNIDPMQVVNITVSKKMISFHHRLLIWEFVSQRIFEKPILGHGFDAMRKEHKFGNLKREWETYINKQVDPYPSLGISQKLHDLNMPYHAHNLSLQVWYELGIIGVILAAALLIIAAKNISLMQLKSKDAGMVNACFAGIILIMHSSFDIWQTWWVSICIIIITLLKHILQTRDT